MSAQLEMIFQQQVIRYQGIALNAIEWTEIILSRQGQSDILHLGFRSIPAVEDGLQAPLLGASHLMESCAATGVLGIWNSAAPRLKGDEASKNGHDANEKEK